MHAKAKKPSTCASANIPNDAPLPIPSPNDWQEFEQYCLDVIEDWVATFHPGKKFKKLNATPSPVDIIFEEENFEGALNFENSGVAQVVKNDDKYAHTYFIECKFRSRPLSLDEVAKSVLVAIRYQPKKFTLATLSSLPPQAQEYVNFFAQKCYIGQTSFLIWLPLENPNCVRLPRRLNPTSNDKPLYENYNVVSASLYQEDAFSSIFINATATSIYITNQQSLRFKAVIAPPRFLKKQIINITLNADTSKKCECICAPVLISEDAFCENINVEVILESNRFFPGKTYKNWELKLSSPRYSEALPLSTFPDVTLSSFAPVLNDMREEISTNSYERWLQSGLPITLVSGQSGIGKSYFCRKLCSKARNDGYIAVEASMLGNSEVGFVANLVWSVISPEMHNTLRSHGDSLKTFIHSWKILSCSDIHEHEMVAIEKLLSCGSLEDVASDALLEVVARMLVNRGIPIVFYASDLHKADPIVAECLWKLIKGFDQSGWGQVKIILERRKDSVVQKNTLWTRIIQDFNDRLWKCDAVVPLDKQKIAKILSQSIFCHDRLNVAIKIVEKSGSDIQHLNVLLRNLLSQKVLQVESVVKDDVFIPQYVVSSLAELEASLKLLPPARKEATIKLIEDSHQSYMEMGCRFGSRWLGLLAIIGMPLDVMTLANITGLETEIVDTELALLVDDNFLVFRNSRYAFAHESIIDAAYSWFCSVANIKRWIRESVLHPHHATQFDEALARGKLWGFLGASAYAFAALNAAIVFAQDNFLKRIHCHMEMHRLLLECRAEGHHREFFENFSAIGWYGHYTLPIKQQIDLNNDAIEYHSSLNMLDYCEPYYSSTLSMLHRLNAWLYLQDLNQAQYYFSSSSALLATKNIHEISMMLNRFVLLCRHWGIYAIGIQGVLAAIVLCDEVSVELDPSLRSVNYSMSAPLVAESSAGLDGRLRFLEEACSNPHATQRELAHNQLALADTLILKKRFGEAASAIAFAKSTIDNLAMESLNIGYYKSLGLLHAAKAEWGVARDAFKLSLSKSLWLGHRLDVVQVAHNLLICHIKMGNFSEAKETYALLLKECVENYTKPDVEAASALLVGILNKSREIMTRNSVGTDNLDIRMKQKAAKFDIVVPIDSQTCQSLLGFVLHNLQLVSRAFPDIFVFSKEIRQFQEEKIGQTSSLLSSNSMPCELNELVTAYLVC